MKIRYTHRKDMRGEPGYYRVFSNLGRLVGLFSDRDNAVVFAKTNKHNQLVESSKIFVDDKDILMTSFDDVNFTFDFTMTEVAQRLNREQHVRAGNVEARPE